jgi:hypothetical protein
VGAGILNAGHRGHNAPRHPGLRVVTVGQKRGITPQINTAEQVTGDWFPN